MTAKTEKLLVAMISKSAHSSSHRAALVEAGFDVLDLGDHPTAIPSRVDLVVCRPQSCAHGGTKTGLRWAREDGRDRWDLLLSDSLTEIVQWATERRQTHLGSEVPESSAPDVRRVSGAMRYLFDAFGFYFVDQGNSLTYEQVCLAATLIGSKSPTGHDPEKAKTALLTVRGANSRTQRRRLSEMRTGGAVFARRRSGGLLLRGRGVKAALAQSPEAQELLGCVTPEAAGKTPPSGASEASEVLRAVIQAVPNASAAEVPAQEAPAPVAPAPEAPAQEAPVIGEETLVPEAAALPPTEAHEETPAEVPAAQSAREEVEEAIRLLHSYMADAGVSRVVVTATGAEVTRVEVTRGSFSLGGS